jgi:hypothetical protein
MFNDSYDFDQFPGWTQGRKKVSNPRLTSFSQDCEEQSIVHDLQQFLRLLDQFMTQNRIRSLADMNEKNCSEFLIKLRNHESHPIVEVKARNVKDEG